MAGPQARSMHLLLIALMTLRVILKVHAGLMDSQCLATPTSGTKSTTVNLGQAITRRVGTVLASQDDCCNHIQKFLNV